jgi:hypothetical protein
VRSPWALRAATRSRVVLVAGDFLLTRIVDDELVDQFQQAGRVEQPDDGAVLLGGQAVAFSWKAWRTQ